MLWNFSTLPAEGLSCAAPCNHGLGWDQCVGGWPRPDRSGLGTAPPDVIRVAREAARASSCEASRRRSPPFRTTPRVSAPARLGTGCSAGTAPVAERWSNAAAACAPPGSKSRTFASGRRDARAKRRHTASGAATKDAHRTRRAVLLAAYRVDPLRPASNPAAPRNPSASGSGATGDDCRDRWRRPRRFPWAALWLARNKRGPSVAALEQRSARIDA